MSKRSVQLSLDSSCQEPNNRTGRRSPTNSNGDAKREAQELKQLETELAPTPKPNVEPEVIQPELTLIADPDAKYVVRKLKRLNRGS